MSCIITYLIFMLRLKMVSSQYPGYSMGMYNPGYIAASSIQSMSPRKQKDFYISFETNWDNTKVGSHHSHHGIKKGTNLHEHSSCDDEDKLDSCDKSLNDSTGVVPQHHKTGKFAVTLGSNTNRYGFRTIHGDIGDPIQTSTIQVPSNGFGPEMIMPFYNPYMESTGGGYYSYLPGGFPSSLPSAFNSGTQAVLRPNGYVNNNNNVIPYTETSCSFLSSNCLLEGDGPSTTFVRQSDTNDPKQAKTKVYLITDNHHSSNMKYPEPRNTNSVLFQKKKKISEYKTVSRSGLLERTTTTSQNNFDSRDIKTLFKSEQELHDFLQEYQKAAGEEVTYNDDDEVLHKSKKRDFEYENNIYYEDESELWNIPAKELDSETLQGLLLLEPLVPNPNDFFSE